MSSKAKTPKQAAKKAQNEAAYALRCARHQEAMKQRDIEKNERLVLLAQQAEQRRFVEAALAGPKGAILLRFLAGREATFDRVNRFMQGKPKKQQAAQAA
jgi:hypothetical protein